MVELTLVVATHHFLVRSIQAAAYPHVISFTQRFIERGQVRIPNPGRRPTILFNQPVRVYAAATADRKEFRFHINCLPQFLEHMALHFIKDEKIQRIDLLPPAAKKVRLPIKPEWSDRDHQVPVISYGLQDLPVSKFVDLQTGKGKSYSAMRIMAERGVLAVILIKPMYIDKWILDIAKTYDIDTKRIMRVEGGKHLMALIDQAKMGLLDCDLILISNKTYQNWLKTYERFGAASLDLGYGCTPEQFFETLEAGFRLIDEVHQDFHLNFKLDLYTHVEQSLSLSATLLGDNDFINSMYELAYPLKDRYQGGAYDKYARAEAIIYRAADPRRLRWKDAASGYYSHHTFEQSLLRKGNEQMLSNYFTLIRRVLENKWLGAEYHPGDRAIVFVASIAMATALTEYLKKIYPTKDVRRYVEDDPYDNLMDPDLRVSTLLSAGTAVDIALLTHVVMTTALSSSQGNVQGFGRLRKLPDERTPTFSYFVCEDIPKHIEYHEKKRKILETRALHYKAVYVPQAV